MEATLENESSLWRMSWGSCDHRSEAGRAVGLLGGFWVPANGVGGNLGTLMEEPVPRDTLYLEQLL